MSDRKTADCQGLARPQPVSNTKQTGATLPLVVYVSSEGMGRGDEELGAILMAVFLDTLSQLKGNLSHAIFLNAGAKLTVDGSGVLEQIRQLEQLGAKVLVCGTCLNHFGIKDQLAVGSISNMYEIIETLSKAGRIIRP
jgi:selenium metabolism protein YedF